jgi:hypothetical protein
VEPRATPAATRGRKPCPHITAAITKPDSKTDTGYQDRNAPECFKHLKSVVLWWWADPVAALAVACFALREGREAWHGELACDD